VVEKHNILLIIFDLIEPNNAGYDVSDSHYQVELKVGVGLARHESVRVAERKTAVDLNVATRFGGLAVHCQSVQRSIIFFSSINKGNLVDSFFHDLLLFIQRNVMFVCRRQSHFLKNSTLGFERRN